VSDKEVSDVVEFLTTRQQEAVVYDEAVVNAVNTPSMADSQAFGGDRDAYFEEAGKFIIEKEKASIGLIQRFYKVGFNRAARIMDQLCDAGVVGPEEGTKPRKILMTMEEFEAYLQEN
jgi:S-DNA-T family DNA segregation ATPase FtsK/SpoIIIE